MKATLGIVLALLLTGCGSMSVEVSVLNPSTVEQELDRRLLRETLPKVISQSELAVEQSIVDVQNEHFGFVTRLSQDYSKAGWKREAADLQQGFSKRWKRVYDDAKQQLLAIRKEVLELNRKLAQAGSEEQRKAIETTIAQELRVRNNRLGDLKRLIQLEIGRALDEAEGIIKISKITRDEGKQAVEASKRSLTGGQGIVEDPYAYTVASAEDSLWAHQFNTVVGKGTFGNFNMAVKMEDLGDFTLKGLTFDPSDVARVASKVTTQALLLASQIAGVPVDLATSDTSSGGEGLRVSSKRLTDAQNAQALEEAKIEAHEEGLMALAATVLREWPSLESDAQRVAGISAIKGSFAANKPRIKMEQESSASPPADNDEEDDATADADAGEDDEDDEDDDTEDETDDDPPGLGATDSPIL